MSGVFDRCDEATRSVLDAGREEARRLGHDWLGTEHLLLALLGRREVLPQSVAELLPDEAAVRSALGRHVGERPPVPAGELLATLGIDLDEVRAAVGRTFGVEAVERLRRPVHQPWQPWRHSTRRCMTLLAGRMGLAPRVKQALEIALADATRRGKTTVDPAGLLLGMLEVEGMAARLLFDVGAPLDDIRGALR